MMQHITECENSLIELKVSYKGVIDYDNMVTKFTDGHTGKRI